MRLLLDTHVVWWALFEPQRLRQSVAELIEAVGSTIYYSPLFLFELAHKRALGKFEFDHGQLLAELDSNGFVEMPLRRAHSLRGAMLPRLHRDPFDRLLIGQALEEDLPLVTGDAMIRRYDVVVVRP